MRVSIAHVADLIGACDRTVSKWIKSSGLVAFDDGKFESRSILRLKIMESVEGGGSKVLDLQTESARLKAAQANKTEMEVAEKEGVLVNAEEVSEAMGKMIMECRAKLLTLPKKLALAVCPDDVKAAENEAERLIFEALDELAHGEDGTMEIPT